MSRDWEPEAEVEVEPSPAMTLAGYRHLATGVLRSARFVQHDPGEAYEPVFTGGPAAIAPLLEALIHLADDRSEGQVQRNGRFLDHRLAAQRALSEFVDAGGQLP